MICFKYTWMALRICVIRLFAQKQYSSEYLLAKYTLNMYMKKNHSLKQDNIMILKIENKYILWRLYFTPKMFWT